MIKWKESFASLAPYKPGKREEAVMKELGLSKITKLSSNENPLGASPHVKKFRQSILDQLEFYPDGSASDLKEGIAAFYDLKESEIIITAGVDELIALISRALLTKETNTVMANPTFVQYRQNALIEGAEIREVPLLTNGEHDLEGMLSQIDDKTSIVWICNPNNPTGHYVEWTEVARFLKQVPEDVLVVLDEAYLEYVLPVPEKHEHFIRTFKNLIITRTFSKIYGLASARVGYGLADAAIIQKLNVLRPPFNTTAVSQALAKAALYDQEFVANCRLENAQGIKLYEAFAAKYSTVKLYPSQGNFILIDLGIPAHQIFSYLESHGYITRSGAFLGFENAVRITIGRKEANQAVIELLEKLLQKQGRR